MANQMTAREQRFAALLLETTKVDAYGQAGYSQKGSRATQTVDAYRLSKRPKVQQEVARLLQQRAFPADDYKRLQETAIAALTEILLYAPDSRVRLKAGSILLAYAAAGLEKPRETPAAQPPDHTSEVIAELRGLYAKALGTEPPPLVEPVEVEAAEQPAGDYPEPEVPENPEPEPKAAGSTSAAHFQLERIPGRFGPGQYRRVRVPES
jgi:hypothetical protein